MGAPGWLLLAAAAAAATSACGSARRGAPYGAPVPLTEREAHGEVVFMHYCNACHPGGAGGLGPALNNKSLPPGLIRLQVREGVGDMPAFDTRTLSEDDLGAVVDYLVALRRARGS